MQNNYERLFDELSELLSEEEVQKNLDKNLKQRIDRLYAQKGKKYVLQKINDLSKNDTQELFDSSMNEDISNKFQRIVLKQKNDQNSHNRKNISNHSISKQKKQFYHKPLRKEVKSNAHSNRLLINKSKQKSKKNIASYSTLILNKSKSKQKSRYNVPENLRQSQSKTKLKTVSSQKTGKKLSMFEKNQKQNFSLYPKFSKNQRSNSKVQEDKYFSNLYLTKKKSNTSGVNESKQVLKKLAVLDTESSRSRVSSNNYHRQSKKQMSTDKQINFFEAINVRQEEVNDQKNQLQQIVKNLKEKIERQQVQLNNSNKNIERYQKDLSKIIGLKEEYSLEVQISRKKSENFFSETRQIEKKIVQTSKTNDTLMSNITEEKYLIDMYQTVIEEMRIQLKIQQQEKVDTKKKLVLLKNTEKMMAQKYISRKGLSEQIFESMKESLKKWG